MHSISRATGVALAALWLVGCGGGGGSASGLKGTSGDLIVVKTEPADNGRLYLNEPIRIDFSNAIDLTSADLNSFTFVVFDATGKGLAEQPTGTFRLATSPGDTSPGRRLEFVPLFPTNDAYDNGGFRPGRRYVVQLIGGDTRNDAVLRDTRGKTLRNGVAFSFTTANGTTPSVLFRDTKAGGPRRAGFSVSAGTLQQTALNLLGQPALEIRLRFDQPLNPASTNVPINLDIDPVRRDIGRRGRVFLLYDDPDPLIGPNRWIPADVDLELNTLEASEVVLRPAGVLPNNALVRVIVENTLEDMSGESNVNDAAYNRVFGTFQTSSSYEPAFDAMVDVFDSRTQIDRDAPFLEPRAEIGAGFVRSNFEFEGEQTILEYQPVLQETILSTDFTQITPKGGSPINVTGGIFKFKNVLIPQGTTVKATGSKPMVWLVTNDFTVDGTLMVNGGDGGRGGGANVADIPTPGGIGNASGGNGGRGSPKTNGPDEVGENGFGSGQVKDGGGKGGVQSCVESCGRASGGGGGSFAVQGDPNYKNKANGNSFIQQKGVGGFGCKGASTATTRTLAGGNPGPVTFTDVRADNNFWGSAVDVFRQIRIQGELPAVTGGQGGGGGGDSAVACGANPNWKTDYRGGGGGGGAGVLIIKALGSIRIGSTGQIRADGGNGGGGEPQAANTKAGGGGGAGGMVILMAARTIEWITHGETYANNDFNYAISAEGGASLQEGFQSITGKYITNPTPQPHNAGTYDSNPTGAFGGNGVVQLMAPAGDNADGTNTVLDDNIVIISGTTKLAGAAKQRYLAWRGVPDETNTPRDDKGLVVSIGDNEGDIRPAPILLPAPFGPISRARSKWIDTGSSVRREVPQVGGDGLPRGITTAGGSNLYRAGPEFVFYGTNVSNPAYTGYLDYVQTPTGVTPVFPIPTELEPVMPATVFAANASGTLAGVPAYVFDLSTPALGATDHRYAQLRAELLSASDQVLGDFRILGHTASRVFVSPAGGAMPQGVAKLVVRNKLFDFSVNDVPGFGATQAIGSRNVPSANARIGFAFHVDPSAPKLKVVNNVLIDENRFPQPLGEFLRDVNAYSEALRVRKMPFVQWDIELNMLFSEDLPKNLRDGSIKPGDPRIALRYLVLPYRF